MSHLKPFPDQFRHLGGVLGPSPSPWGTSASVRQGTDFRAYVFHKRDILMHFENMQQSLRFYSKTQKGAISVQSSMNPTYFCHHVQQEFHLHQSEFHMNTICTRHLINQTPLQERKRTFFLQNIYKLSPYL